MSGRSIVIVGGGIAGPALALALRRAMRDTAASAAPITILEGRLPDDPTLEAGGGFTLSANALAALSSLGGTAALLRAGATPTSFNKLHNGDGKLLGRLGLGDPVALPFAAGDAEPVAACPAVTVRRCALAKQLTADAAALGVRVELGKRVSNIIDEAHFCRVVCVDGTEYEAELVIGCDGLRSVVRRHVDPAASIDGASVNMLNFGGIVSPADVASVGLPEGHDEAGAWHMYFGRNAFFGFQLIDPLPHAADSALAGGRGKGSMMWFVNVAPEAFDMAAPPSDDLAALAALFRDDVPFIAALLGKASLDLSRLQTRAIEHCERWHRGRCIVIGDAAHAPSPTSGQGAGMAVEDAVELAMALRAALEPRGRGQASATPNWQRLSNRGLADAFALFERSRRARVEKIVTEASKMSKHKNPTSACGRKMRDVILGSFVFPSIAKPAKSQWLFGYHVDIDASLEDQVAQREAAALSGRRWYQFWR